VRRSTRRLLVVACLLPLIALLARQTPRFLHDPLLLSYGMCVLASTI
jgi:hypothetical protein